MIMLTGKVTQELVELEYKDAETGEIVELGMLASCLVSTPEEADLLINLGWA
jgi:hypothetical protein